MKHDAIYARYSSHAQDDGTSIEVQLEQCERAAGAKCQHYIDRAKTGRSLGGRTELIRLLADAEAGKIARVFVYKFDRLGRAAETHVIAQQLDDAGVPLVSATEGTNELARGIQLVVAQDYSRQLAQRTRDGLVKRFEQGAFTGGIAPYGYHVADRSGVKMLEVDPTEAAVIREIAEQYIAGRAGLKIIARQLRQRGIASRRGRGWAYTSVRSVLVNPVYTGRVTYNVRKMNLNRQTGRRVPKMNGQADVIERQDDTLRILDDATFAAIQQRMALAARGQTVRAPRGIQAFTGLVYCECGSKCYRCKSSNAKGTYHYYLCGRSMRYAEECPHAGRIREDRLIEMVNNRFKLAFDDAEGIIAEAVKIAMAATQDNRQEAQRFKRDLADVQAQQDRLVELLIDPDVSAVVKASVNRKAAALEQRRAELQGALDGLGDEANRNTEGLAEAIGQAFTEARDNLAAAATPAEFNRAVEDVMGPMTITPEGIRERELPTGDAGGSLLRCIAGGGFEPPTSGL